MNKNQIGFSNTLIIIAIIFIGIISFCLYQKTSQEVINTSSQIDYKNISYEIDGQIVTLKNGVAEVEILPDSTSKNIIRYFGNEVEADLNGDGLQDVAFLLTQDNGGSGIFYYAVAALKISEGYTGTNAIFIGDRIAPQTTEFKDGEIIVNYADREQNEPMTAQPSIGVSKYLKINENRLVEVLK